jgi:hypothetical protein
VELRSPFRDTCGRDPTWDEPASSSVVPYLDVAVHETLRLHTSTISRDFSGGAYTSF